MSAAIIGWNWGFWDLCLPTARIKGAPIAVQRVKLPVTEADLFNRRSSGRGLLDRDEMRSGDGTGVEFGRCDCE